MKAFYSRKAKMAFSALFALVIVNSNGFAQAPTSCSPFPGQSCTNFGATNIPFTTGPENFSGSGGFTYNSTNGNFDASIAAASGPNNYTIVSRIFVLQGDLIAIGFNTTGSTATLNTYTVEVIRNSDNTVLGTCVTSTPTAGPICYGIQDADFTAGTEVRFRVTINATNASAGSQVIIFDDFTFNATQAVVLPVTLSAFKAKRTNNNVTIEWTTANELNISGFEVQKRGANNTFTTVAYVNSKSTNGNSLSTLQYSYTDNNTAADVNYYRLKTIGKDGEARYSDIRSVDGLKNKAKMLIYPNPSNSNIVNIIFGSNDQKDIQLTDIQGREIRSWKSYKDQSLKLDNLVNGIYMLRVTNLITSEKEIQKIVVSAK